MTCCIPIRLCHTCKPNDWVSHLSMSTSLYVATASSHILLPLPLHLHLLCIQPVGPNGVPLRSGRFMEVPFK